MFVTINNSGQFEGTLKSASKTTVSGLPNDYNAIIEAIRSAVKDNFTGFSFDPAENCYITDMIPYFQKESIIRAFPKLSADIYPDESQHVVVILKYIVTSFDINDLLNRNSLIYHKYNRDFVVGEKCLYQGKDAVIIVQPDLLDKNKVSVCICSDKGLNPAIYLTLEDGADNEDKIISAIRKAIQIVSSKVNARFQAMTSYQNIQLESRMSRLETCKCLERISDLLIQ